MNDKELQTFLADPAGFLRQMTFKPPGGKNNGTDAETDEIVVPKGPLTKGADKIPVVGYLPKLNHWPIYMMKSDDRLTCYDTLQDNCAQVDSFYLGWESGQAWFLKLENIKGVDFFVTADVNACCIYINGSREEPLICHANYDSPDLKVKFDRDRDPVVQMREATEKQEPLYRRFYSNLAIQLIEGGHFSSHQPLSIFDPSLYTSLGGEKARVFGLKRVGQWTFYYNVEDARGKKTHFTRQLWPKFERLDGGGEIEMEL